MSVFTKLKQFKDLRDQGKKLQDLLAGESTTVKTAGDKVLLTIDGNLQITALAIDDELLNPGKKDTLIKAIKSSIVSAQTHFHFTHCFGLNLQVFGNILNFFFSKPAKIFFHAA